MQRLIHTAIATESFKGGPFCSQIKIKPHTKGPHTFLVVWDIMPDFQKDKSIRCIEKQGKKTQCERTRQTLELASDDTDFKFSGSLK